MGAAEKIAEKIYTLEAYLAMEEAAENKSEFWNGLIVEMAGGTPNHNRIANSIGRCIENELDKKNKDCSTFNSDQKVYIPEFNRGVYPDSSIICGEIEMHEKSNAMVTNPCLIIEVLSESTKDYDKGTKFEGYRSLPSFKEYLLVWQTIPKVQSWFKEDVDLWRISNAFGLDKSIHLYSIDCTIQLKDIYRRVNNLGDKDDLETY
ncbi:MAG: Uma2 family endonuclease [Bacteroidota bacterium]